MAWSESRCCACPFDSLQPRAYLELPADGQYRYFTSVFVSLGVFLFGYDQGVMSGIITYVF